MMSKRWTYSLPVKVLAAVVCVTSLISAGVFTAAAIVRDQLGSTEEALIQDVHDEVSRNYSAYVLSELQGKGEFPDMSDTGFAYAVLETNKFDLSEVDLKDSKLYIKGAPADAADYETAFHGEKGGYYNYYLGENALWKMFTYGSYYYADDSLSRTYVPIEQFVYAYDEGLFYYRTVNGDYPAKNICIAEQTRLELDEFGNFEDDGSYEELVQVDSEICYGVNYRRFELVRMGASVEPSAYEYVDIDTGEPLDISNCENWREVGFYNQDWAWCAGFDARFVKKDKVEITGTPAEEGMTDYDRIAPESEEVEVPQEAAANAEEPTEDATSGQSAAHGAESVLYTTPKENALKPVSYNQLKPVAAEDQLYSIYSKNSICIRTPDDQRVHYWVLSKASVPDVPQKNNLYAQADHYVNLFYKLSEHSVLFEIISVIVMLISLFVFCTGAGHRSDRDEIVITWLDKIPFELVTIVVAGLLGLCIGGCVLVGEGGQSLSLMVSVWAEMAAIAGAICMVYLATFLVRLKGRCFWRYTLVYWCLYWCMKPFIVLRRMMRENVPLFWKGFGIIGGSMFAEGILLLCVAFSGEWGLMLFVLLICMIVRFMAYLWLLMQMKRLEDGTRVVAQGNFTQKIATDHLLWNFKKHAEDINNIGENMDKAVHEQMKSEHLRTELITNVSHDIKTPLTSIINYVDLIGKLDLTDPTLMEYVEVLTRQSARLKKLIEDLIEASKASTGNLKVDMEKTDAAVLLQQAAGEFEQRLETRNLQLVIDCPEPPVEIMADGRHLWRVFDNLLSNVCKYAMEGTRVYISLSQNASGTDIIFRNISASQLNISSDELMERFVRGDSSRNTEGSGLGLSIAQSLMKLMHGEMRILVDGDLFKVTLHFGDGDYRI